MTLTDTLRKTASMAVVLLALYAAYIMLSSLYEFVLFNDSFSLSMAMSAGFVFGILIVVAYAVHPSEASVS